MKTFDNAIALFNESKPKETGFEWRQIKRKCAANKKHISISEQGKVVLGILKIGANITFSGAMHKSAANFDIASLCRALAPNFHLHFITKITRNTVIPKQSSITDIGKAHYNINDLGLDAIVVFNGSFNAYGGIAPQDTIAVWKIINNFKGRVFYVHTDGMMKLHQVWNENWIKKGWAKGWNRDDLVITRDDIVYITQARSISRMYALTRANSAINIKRENILHFPVDQAILLRPPKPKRERIIRWDLIYGGSFRSGRRRDAMVKWFFGHQDLETLMFGSLGENKFGNPRDEPYPTFEGPVVNSDFVRKLSTGLSTVIIVDDWYRNHWMTLRFYESLIAETIPFIDFAADTSRKLYFPGSAIEDFLYVRKRKDLNERVNLIKNEDCANEVIDLCRDSVRSRWDASAYIERLSQLIKSKI